MAVKKGTAKLIFKRSLRTEMTEPERRMWTRLRSRQICGFKFRRQHGIGPYIVDFFCPERKLAVEIDGETHGEAAQQKDDLQRDAYLQKLGVRVVRYLNADVMQNLDGVLEDLQRQLG